MTTDKNDHKPECRMNDKSTMTRFCDCRRAVDKIVEEVLPDSFASGSDSYNAGFFGGRELLKQAIEQGRLVVPMSMDSLELNINLFVKGMTGKMFDLDAQRELATAICEAQFKDKHASIQNEDSCAICDAKKRGYHVCPNGNNGG